MLSQGAEFGGSGEHMFINRNANRLLRKGSGNRCAGKVSSLQGPDSFQAIHANSGCSQVCI